MQEIRLVGRGGQGVVTAGELLGKAAVVERRFAQAIPTFGPERRGALSSCTLRISDERILAKYSGTQPDVLVVLDPTIWRGPNVLVGLPEGATLVFNTAETPAAIDGQLRNGAVANPVTLNTYRLLTVDATSIALKVLGRPITNTAMMGALSGATGAIQMESIEQVLTERFGGKAQLNIDAAHAAREQLQERK